MTEPLYSILKPYDHWMNDMGEQKNQEAKEALINFYKVLVRQAPAKEYEISPNVQLHFNYLHFFVRIKIALDNQLYMRTCNELISLIHYESLYQGRIYFNVLKILEEYFGVGDLNYGFQESNGKNL